MKNPKFKVGQVVNLKKKLDSYARPEQIQRAYQQIVAIEPWGDKGYGGWCLTFADKNRCHEKWATKLTKSESGRGGN